jgi:hypothetical protein
MDQARLFGALYDELERQGIYKVDVARLSVAVCRTVRGATEVPQGREPYQRCANGACE